MGRVTPYTSYLIIEDERTRNVPLSLQSMRQLNDDATAKATAGHFMGSMDGEAKDPANLSGLQATDNAHALNDLKFGMNETQAQPIDNMMVAAAAAQWSYLPRRSHRADTGSSQTMPSR